MTAFQICQYIMHVLALSNSNPLKSQQPWPYKV